MKYISADSWSATEQEIESITDGLGKPIDNNIKQAVIALRVYGFPTTGSCEGHLDWGLPYPWIDVNEEEPVDLVTNKSSQEAWRKANLHQQQHLLALLTQFYKGRTTPFDAQLAFEPGRYEAFRLQSRGGNIIRILPKEQQQGKLTLYQREMAAFAAFLKTL